MYDTLNYMQFQHTLINHNNTVTYKPDYNNLTIVIIII